MDVEKIQIQKQNIFNNGQNNQYEDMGILNSQIELNSRRILSTNIDEKIQGYNFFNLSKLDPIFDVQQIIDDDQSHPNLIVATSSYIYNLNHKRNASNETFSRILHDESENDITISLKISALYAKSKLIKETNDYIQGELILIISRTAKLLSLFLEIETDRENATDVIENASNIERTCLPLMENPKKFLEYGFLQIFLLAFDRFRVQANLKLIEYLCLSQPHYIYENTHSIIDWMLQYVFDDSFKEKILISLSSFANLSQDVVMMLLSKKDFVDFIDSQLESSQTKTCKCIAILLSCFARYAEIEEIFQYLDSKNFGNLVLNFLDTPDLDFLRILIEGVLQILLKGKIIIFDQDIDLIEELNDLYEANLEENTKRHSKLEFLSHYKEVPISDLILDVITCYDKENE